METPQPTFEVWEAHHRDELIGAYRDYLCDVLDDAGFDIRHVEDYWTWTREEYEILRQCADEEAVKT
jgi:hypothetical protein